MKPIRIAALILMIAVSLAATDSTAKKASPSPTIDGVIEALWMEGVTFQSFKQIEPVIMAEPTVRTEAYFLYDEQNVYLAAKLFQNKNTICSSRGRKDSEQVMIDDHITFALDPLNNGSAAIMYIVNAENAVWDGHLLNDGEISDPKWDSIFYSAVKVFDDFWSVEVQIPLSSIQFQEKKIQDWGICVYRYYAQNQEKIINQIADADMPYKISNFFKIEGLENLSSDRPFTVAPYMFGSSVSSAPSGWSGANAKTGVDLKYSPKPSISVLGTLNPDYAQIETDREIINVSDLPTEYPEKRPFFIESNDFYPGAAVNTRNITDIKVGLKVKKAGSILNYDATGVIDGDNHEWVLGNIRLSDGKSYLAEVIGGLKNQESRYDYNITTHAVKWLFDKKLSVYNWTGTINSPERGRNEWETVNSVKWQSRALFCGMWAHIKSKYYNPNVVGWNYLSNQIDAKTWIQYSKYSDSGLFRVLRFGIWAEYFDLYTDWNNGVLDLKFAMDHTIRLGDSFGNWVLGFSYFPDNQKFRYRNTGEYIVKPSFEDEIGPFALIYDPAASCMLSLQSDYSKSLGMQIQYNNRQVRKSSAENVQSEVFWKLDSRSVVKYSVEYIHIAGSPYQDKHEQAVHRLHAEYNLTDKLNLRAIYQPNTMSMKHTNWITTRETTLNTAVTWQYAPGSFLYLVYDRSKVTKAPESPDGSGVINDQTFVVKFNKTFSL